MNRQRVEPGPGQESVWDYPRPPRVEDVDKKVKVVFGGVTLAYTTRAKRVLETSHPPVYYIPQQDIQMEFLSGSGHTSHCEWKGRASHYDIATNDEITGEEKSEKGAALSRPGGCVRRTERSRRLLPFQNGRVLGWGGEGRGAGRGLLWGLDHPGHCRPFQGRSRHLGLVDTSWILRAFAKNIRAQAWIRPM
jgi:uncharacterized protein (DUF427 family)